MAVDAGHDVPVGELEDQRPRVFLSYRRGDTDKFVARVYERLTDDDRFGRVFLDRRVLRPGDDIAPELRAALHASDVVVAAIGRGWQPERLASSTDYILYELTTALGRGLMVIPVLVNDAELPVSSSLPTDVQWIRSRLAARVRRGKKLDDDLDALVDTIYERGEEARDRRYGAGLSVRYDDLGDLSAPETPVESPSRGPRPSLEPVLPDLAPRRFVSRELAWLDFNQRVLELAEDKSLPLAERVRFCAIFSSNLDDFFGSRVAVLQDRERVMGDAGGLTQQLDEIYARARELANRQEDVFVRELIPALAESGIALTTYRMLDDDARERLDEMFTERIFPILTPLAVDAGRPFPYVSDRSLSLGVILRVDAMRKFARVKVPTVMPRFVKASESAFVALDDLIKHNIGQLFPGAEVLNVGAFRVRRAALLDEPDEDEELSDEEVASFVELELRRRRFQRALRMECEPSLDAEVLSLLREEFEVGSRELSVHRTFLGLDSIAELPITDERPPPTSVPVLATSDSASPSLIQTIERGDLLVHHPYHSFVDSVVALAEEAAATPGVHTMKVCLYRLAEESRLAAALINAAKAGITVVACVELRAREDEAHNLEVSRRFEDAGVEVHFGSPELKTHSKCMLIESGEGDEVQRIAHIGTGNYHEKTSAAYEDLGLFTADREMCADVAAMFTAIQTNKESSFRAHHIAVAPMGLRTRVLEDIEREARAGEDGRITMKVNGLTDHEIIDALYFASQAGVRVDLIVRSMCSLVPGVAGMSENIRVRSTLGHYLEHSRIFRFGNGEGPGQPSYLIGSADMMERNLDRRVEALVPLRRAEHRRHIDQVLALHLRDDVANWRLDAMGRWRRPSGSGLFDTQQEIRRLVERGINPAV